jgi:hypothetical protein
MKPSSKCHLLQIAISKNKWSCDCSLANFDSFFTIEMQCSERKFTFSTIKLDLYWHNFSMAVYLFYIEIIILFSLNISLNSF